MDKAKVLMMIQDFFDGELEPSQEPKLFSLLAEDELNRAYFKQLHLLKETAGKEMNDFPQELEERIFANIQKSEDKHTRGIFGWQPPALLAYAAVFAALIFALLFAMQGNGEKDFYEFRYRQAMHTIQEQNLKIELLFNSYSGAQVTDYLNNKVIVKPGS